MICRTLLLLGAMLLGSVPAMAQEGRPFAGSCLTLGTTQICGSGTAIAGFVSLAFTAPITGAPASVITVNGSGGNSASLSYDSSNNWFKLLNNLGSGLGLEPGGKVFLTAGANHFYTFNTDGAFCADPLSTFGFCWLNTANGSLALRDGGDTANGNITLANLTASGVVTTQSVLAFTATSGSFKYNGVTQLDFNVSNSGHFTFVGPILCSNCEIKSTITGGGFSAAAGGWYYFGGRSVLTSPSDGNLVLSVNAGPGSGFSLLQLGGVTSSFPSIKRSTTILQARLADDSAYAPFEANTIRTATAYTVATLPAAGSAGRRAYVTDQLTTCAVVGAALTGGGAITCPVFDNGTIWVGG